MIAEVMTEVESDDRLVDMGDDSMPDNPDPCRGCYKEHDGWACPNLENYD